MSRQHIIDLLDGNVDGTGRFVSYSIFGIIIFSAVLLTLESMPEMRAVFGPVLLTLELSIAVLFLVEYGLRVYCAADRWGYIFSFWGVVDAMACIPALLFVFPDFVALRSLRLFRIFRLLKIFRLGRAVDRIERAFANTKDELLVFSFLAIVMIFIAAVGIYHFERNAQPEAYGSIPESLWWALATLTTVGYGDIYPVTGGGRIFTAIVLLIGLGVVAIPAGIVTAALMADDRDEIRGAGPKLAISDACPKL